MPGSSQEEILHKIIDGEARPEEIASLREILDRDPILRGRYDRLLTLTSAMRELGTVDVPPGLRAEILREIRRQPPMAREPSSWLDSIRRGLQRRWLFREATVFAGGALVGVLLLLGIRGEGISLSREDLTGTMLPQSSPADRRLLQRVPVGFDGVEGTLQTFSSAGGVLAQIDLETSSEVVVVLGFSAGSFEPTVLRQSRPTPGGVEIHRDRVLLRHVGDNQYQVFLRPAGSAEGSPLRVEISAQDEWFEETLATAETGLREE